MVDFLNFQWLAGVPLEWAKAAALVTFIGIGLAAWLFPKAYIFEGAPTISWWRDIRWWASGILVIQIILYMVF